MFLELRAGIAGGCVGGSPPRSAQHRRRRAGAAADGRRADPRGALVTERVLGNTCGAPRACSGKYWRAQDCTGCSHAVARQTREIGLRLALGPIRAR